MVQVERVVNVHWIRIGILVLLLILSSIYSMAETAMMSLSRGKVRHLAEEGNPRASWLERLVREPNRLLSTVLVGNNISNVIASTLATALFIGYFGAMGVTWATVVMTLAILMFAEILPKTYAAHNPDRVASKLAPFLEVSARLFFPIAQALTWLAVGVVRAFGGKAEGGRLVTEEEIRNLVEVGEEEGLLEESEREMIQGIFDFGDTVAREVMVPRIDVDALDSTATLSQAADAVVHFGHSRLPIYHQTVDDIVGVIYARDILAFLDERAPETLVHELMRPVHYVPETKKIDELLGDFRRQRTHIAIVLDEYGGTAGIVTIEDLLEEIVGEIQDEYDAEELSVRPIDPHTVEVDGSMQLEELNELLGVDLPHEDFDTIGGLILHLLGRAPVEGEQVGSSGLRFSVAKVVGRRVKRVIVHRGEEAQQTPGGMPSDGNR